MTENMQTKIEDIKLIQVLVQMFQTIESLDLETYAELRKVAIEMIKTRESSSSSWFIH